MVRKRIEKWPKEPKPLFKVGDWVTFLYGAMNVAARVIEDRGPIGHKGRRLFRVEILWEDREPDRFEVAEEDMTAIPPPKNTAKVS